MVVNKPLIRPAISEGGYVGMGYRLTSHRGVDANSGR